MKSNHCILVCVSLLSCAIVGCDSVTDQQTFGMTNRDYNFIPDNTDANQQLILLPHLSEDSTVSDYLTYAALNNAGLWAAFNDWKAAMEQVPQVKSLPDPKFNYRYFIEQVETRVGAQKQSFGITQMFPWFDKLKLRADSAADAADAQRQRYQAVKLKVFFEVKHIYYEYYYLGRAVSIVEENIQLMKNFESVARTRYKAALGTASDLIRAQVELGKLEDRVKSLKDLQGPVTARLNAALNRPAEAALALPRQIEDESVLFTDRELLDSLAGSNPHLAAIQSEIAEDKAGIALARKEYFPDITLGVDFIDTADSISAVGPRDSGQDALIAMFSVNLPIWREKLDAGLRQARNKYQATLRKKTQELNTLNAQLKLATYSFRDAERKINLYRDTLLPKAIESVKTNETSFRAGQNTLLDLIDAQRVMLEFELAYERALSNKAQHLAELEMLVGKEIPRTAEADFGKDVSEPKGNFNN